MVTHTATHRETGCVNALLVDANLFFNGLDHFARELHVVIVGAARTNVPTRTHLSGVSRLRAIGVQRDNAFGVCLSLVGRAIELTLTATHNRMVVHNERYRLVALVGARHVHDERTILAVDVHRHLVVASLVSLAGAVDDYFVSLAARRGNGAR